MSRFIFSPRMRRDGPPAGRRRPRFDLRLGIAVAAALVVISACGRFRSDEPVIPTQDQDVPKVVVLPFSNLGQSEDAFLTVGISKEIVNRFSAVNGIGVISNPDLGEAGDGARSAIEIAGETGGDFLLSGSVAWNHDSVSGRELEVEASLVDSRDGQVAWSQTYLRSLDEIFAIEEGIVTTVLDHLQVGLSETERRAVTARPTENLGAYLAYLRGLLHQGSFERQEISIAEEHFLEAVDLDPSFAAAHAALSECHSLTFHFRYDRSPQRLASAIGSAHRALEIDSSLPDGHRALGYYYYWGQRNYEQALSEFSLAAEGRPNDPQILSAMGVVLRRQGRWQEAVDALHRAMSLNPENDIYVLDLASTYGRMRRWSEALEHCQHAIDLAPNDIYPYVFYARMVRGRGGSIADSQRVLDSLPRRDPGQQAIFRYHQAKYERDFQAARQSLEAAGEMIPDPIDEEIFPKSLAQCEIGLLDGSGRPTDSPCTGALEYLQQAAERSPGDPAVHAALGWAYALVGEKEPAITAGERAVELLPITIDAMAGHTHLIRLAKIYAWVGEPFKAVKLIEKSLRTPGWISVATIAHDPDWDPIRQDPRFLEVIRIHSLEERPE